MNLVDSSAWLAYLADEKNADFFAEAIQDTELLLVPTVCLYEVFKVILRESSENEALQAVVAMQKGTVADMNAPLAIAASKLSLEHNLPMADSIILATAQEFKATLWTQDSGFKNMSNVKYFPKK